MAIRSGYKRDKKTGRLVRKDRKKMMIAKRAARKRRGRHMKPAARLKLRMSLRKARRSGRTKAGRRIIRRAKHR